MADEYIKREALLEEISETVVFTVKKGTPLPTSEMRGANKVIDRIKSAPAADVVEVVRCKDCRKKHTTDCSLWYATFNGTDYFIERGEDFYCSYGERAIE